VKYQGKLKKSENKARFLDEKSQNQLNDFGIL
jgi:hypothetical protein